MTSPRTDFATIEAYSFPRRDLEPIVPHTAAVCSLCKSTHPAAEGITHYRNTYACPCGREWTERWCCGCDGECPACGLDISPATSELLRVIAEPTDA
jgi:hypothetical protein